MPSGENLNIIDGINYDCSGCGICCGGWAVPMTTPDYDRIKDEPWQEMLPRLGEQDLFRPMKEYEKVNTAYTHAIKPGKDGFCPFLENNLCFIHSQFDGAKKPSMCQLFPYSFNETPSGIFLTVSFISMAVCYNKGRALTEQVDYLHEKLKLYRSVYTNWKLDWSKTQLVTGIPLPWEDYLKHEAVILEMLKQNGQPIHEGLIKASKHLTESLPNKKSAADAPPKLNNLDKHLLCNLHKLYFPVKPLGKGEGDFSTFAFFYQLAFQRSRIFMDGKSFSFEELERFPWPYENNEVTDLLYRYLYSRIYGKWYFGAGFGQLSLVTGFHHLGIVYALIKLHSKALAKMRNSAQVELLDVIASVRQMEKRYGDTALNGYAAGLYELLMTSHDRLVRILRTS